MLLLMKLTSPIKQQLSLILKLKLSVKVPYSYIPPTTTSLLFPSNHCLSTLIFTLIGLGVTRHIQLLSTLACIKQHCHLILISLIKEEIYFFTNESQERNKMRQAWLLSRRTMCLFTPASQGAEAGIPKAGRQLSLRIWGSVKLHSLLLQVVTEPNSIAFCNKDRELNKRWGWVRFTLWNWLSLPF